MSKEDKEKKAAEAEARDNANYNPSSYLSVIQDVSRFRATALNDESGMFDMPGHVYFRVLFHFYNNSDAINPQPSAYDADFTDTSNDAMSGLLAPSWMLWDGDQTVPGIIQRIKNPQVGSDIEILWNHSTAFNYFVTNNDPGRAQAVMDFIELLSNINSRSPWYFQNVKGIDTAITRSMAHGDFMFKEDREKITIECLDDSYDQRVGTLLDLYRSFTWSWETKRVMLPSNLRKFDMTVIAFQLPLKGLHVSRNKNAMTTSDRRSDSKSISNLTSLKITPNGFTVFYGADETSMPVASYKAFEFHGCEFDYNSSATGYADLNNMEGGAQKYSIGIFYDDVYEIRFNEFLGRTITDMMQDLSPTLPGSETEMKTPDNDHPVSRKELSDDDTNPKTVTTTISGELPTETKIPQYKKPNAGIALSVPANGTNIFGGYSRPGTGIINQLIGHAQAWTETKLKKIYLGNIGGLSLSTLRRQVDQLVKGDVFATAANVSNYVRGNWDGGNAQLGENIFPSDQEKSMKELGNIFKANTVINS